MRAGDFSKPLIIAHRGYSARYPENTLLAFRKAVKAGAGMVEMDVRLSKDHRVVVCHDAGMRRLFGVKGRIADLPVAVIQERSSGSIPLFEDVLRALRGKTLFYVEIKSERLRHKALGLLVNKAWETMRAAGVSKDCLVASFDYRVAREYRRLNPKGWTGFICSSLRALRIAKAHRFAHLDAVCPHRSLLTLKLARALKAQGLQIFPWVLDAPDQQAQARDLGVDGIVTNDPRSLAKFGDRSLNSSD